MTTINTERSVTLDDVSDIGVIAFGVLALAALLVSVPATYSVMSHFHAADEVGQTQALASLIVFEIGAITAKLSTLWVPQWRGRLHALQAGLLLFVMGANVYASTRLFTGWEVMGSVFFAALMPAFTAIFLALAAARAESRRDARVVVPPSPEQRIKKALEAAQARQLELALAGFEQQAQLIFTAPVRETDEQPARVALEAQRAADRAEAKRKLLAYAIAHPEASKQALADAAGVSKTTVYGLLEELKTEGQVRVNGHVEVINMG
jgi:hypothetical protein